MIIDPHMTRHARAMLDPQSDEEKLVVQAFQLLTRIADAYPHDVMGVKAIEGAATATITLLEYLTSSSGIDQATVAQDVYGIVDKSGGDADNI